MTTGMLLVGEVAKQLAEHVGRSCSAEWVRRLTRAGKLEAPRHRIGGMGVYDAEQLPKLKAQFAALPRRGQIGRWRKREE